MNISEIEIQNIRPGIRNNMILGNVTFYISGGVGDRCDTMNFDCSYTAPTNTAACQDVSDIELGLKADALRQARRMPEFRSGKDVLVLLCPSEKNRL
ncbi:hypothetical protein JI58_01535 [Marinosulfonomonas sp. PRT-SC04]|nr:hypothetical protein JI58_01535 [Marinosulfonomonas sp. PRT-SC04]